MPARILIVDDHEILQDCLRLLLEHHPEATVAGSCGDCATAWKMTEDLRPDLVLLDVDLPDGSGIALMRRLLAGFPAIKVLIFTACVQPAVAKEAINAGAHGFLVKTCGRGELLLAINTLLSGGRHLADALAREHQPTDTEIAERIGQVLPRREAQVLALLIKGLRNKEIGAELCLNVKTVETYRARLMNRFDCESPAELVRHAIRQGLVPP